MRFIVYTDEIEPAKKIFPDFEIIKNTGISWRSVRYASYLIIANSSFYILPALLGNAKAIIAPRFWAGRNKGYQQMEQNVYKKFISI